MLDRIRAFARNTMGNFAMMAAVAFPAIFGGVAVAVDLTNTVRVQSELQNANDTAVLFAARFFKEFRRQPTRAQLQAFLDANSSFRIVNPRLVFDPERIEFTLTSETSVKTMLMKFFRTERTRYSALSKANLGFSETLEFALALDTTGSMAADGKMAALKVAANEFIDTMFDAKDKGADVKGAIVPFAQYVNVGLGNRRQSWLAVPRNSDTRATVRKCEMEAPVIGQTNCRQECWPAQTIRHAATGESCTTNDGVRSCTPGRAAWTENRPAGCDNKCDNIYGAEVEVCKDISTGELVTWQGCVGSRNYPLNVRDADYRNRIPGLLGVECSAEIQPLSSNRTSLKGKIDSLTPKGETYMPEGVMWGTRVLSTEAPYTEGRTRGRGDRPVRKVLVLMTDGVNTLSPSFPLHDQSDSAQADAYTREACDEAKAKQMDVFTISFGNGVTNPVRNLLQSCASHPTQYFHAANAAALTKAFSDIADALLNVRLTQ
jgi:Flp pilus assembly protein TadG